MPAETIQKTPGVLGGAARVRNTRIAVWMLINAKQLGLTDAEIRQRYELPLTQADLDAAWAYFREHRDEIEQAIRENDVNLADGSLVKVIKPNRQS